MNKTIDGSQRRSIDILPATLRHLILEREVDEKKRIFAQEENKAKEKKITRATPHLIYIFKCHLVRIR